MKRPTFARLASAFRRDTPSSGPVVRGGVTGPVGGSAGKAAPTPQRRPRSSRVPAPSWHDLVQPGPKGDPEKRLARAERRRFGTFRPVVSKPTRARADQSAKMLPRRELRVYARAQGWEQAGRFVQHRHKPARPSGHALASPKSARGRAQRAGVSV